MLELETTADGVILPVRAQAGARATAFRGIQAGALRVAVTQVAEKGKANKAILKYLGKQLRLPASRLELVSGLTHPQKRVLIRGLTQDELAERIRVALG